MTAISARRGISAVRIREPYTIYRRTLRSGRKVYYYQLRGADGKRTAGKSTGKSTKAEARIYCLALYKSGEMGKPGRLTFKKFTRNFFSESSDYCKWKKASGERITKETLLSYDKFLRNQLLPYFEDFQVKDITRADVKSWIVWGSAKWSAKTMNNAQTALSIIMRQAAEKKIAAENPVAGLKFRKVGKKKREILTAAEVREIYRSGLWKNGKFRQMFLVAAVTGMRISEIAALRNQDVKSGFLDVSHSYSRQFGLGDTKTHAARFVPVPKGLALKSDTEYIFEENGRPVNITRVYNAMLLVCRKIGIDTKGRGITVHTLRNFFISYLQAENVSGAKIRAVAGHKDPTMTGLYTYWKPDMFPEVYEAQEKLFRMITEP